MSFLEKMLIGLILLAFIALIVANTQGANALTSIGQLIAQLTQNVVGTGAKS